MINVDVYIAESKLLIIKWKGKWSIDDYLKAINVFLNKSNNFELQNVIHDISSLDFTFKLSDIKKIADIKKKYISIEHSTVYITEKPQDVVFAQLFADEFSGFSIFHCATIERAIQILELDNNYNAVKEAFNELKF